MCRSLPEVFQEETEEGVKHNVEAEGGASGVFEAGVPEEKAQNDEVSLAFPDLCRPQGLGAVGVVGQGGGGVEDAEVGAGGVAEGVAVHEVRNAADGLAEDDGRSDDVSKLQYRNVPFLQENISGDACKDDAALDGHASLPHEGDFKQVVMVIIPVEEENIPKPSADDTDEGDSEAQVKHAFMPSPSILF